MLLYIIYIEPLLLKFKKELSGVRIADHPLKVGGHVDDQFLFVKNDDDIRRLWCIVESFENCTNALINRQNTRLLGLGAWKERKQWPFEWLTSSPNIKVLGIVFCPTIQETIAMNMKLLQTKVRRGLWGASNRKLAILQKVQFSICTLCQNLSTWRKSSLNPKECLMTCNVHVANLFSVAAWNDLPSSSRTQS
jgi:hypothetical protein